MNHPSTCKQIWGSSPTGFYFFMATLTWSRSMNALSHYHRIMQFQAWNRRQTSPIQLCKHQKCYFKFVITSGDRKPQNGLWKLFPLIHPTIAFPHQILQSLSIEILEQDLLIPHRTYHWFDWFSLLMIQEKWRISNLHCYLNWNPIYVNISS